MKILFLAHDRFLPADSGQRQRTERLHRALAQRGHVLSVVPGSDGPGHLPCPARQGARLRMLRAWSRGESLWAARFADPAVRSVVRRALEEGPDLVVCAGLPSAFVLPPDPGVPVWLDEQNIEWRILERALPRLGALRRRIAAIETPRLRRAEEGAAAAARVVTACSPEDAAAFAGARVLRNVCGDPPAGLGGDRRSGVLLFTGTMEWEPNVDAAEWMARAILPRVRARVPHARLRIVGRNPTARVRELGALEGVEVVGSVPSVWPELAGASVALAPIRMGSGTRIKILEAAAAAVPVVATTMGAEGLGMAEGREILRADRAEGFADACVRLLEAPAEAEAMGVAARAWRERTHGSEAFGRAVGEILDTLFR